MTEPSNTQQLKKQLEGELIKYEDIKRELRISENTINHLRQMICDICIHSWAIDGRSYNEHTEFICNKCGLIR